MCDPLILSHNPAGDESEGERERDKEREGEKRKEREKERERERERKRERKIFITIDWTTFLSPRDVPKCWRWVFFINDNQYCTKCTRKRRFGLVWAFIKLFLSSFYQERERERGLRDRELNCNSGIPEHVNQGCRNRSGMPGGSRTNIQAKN